MPSNLTTPAGRKLKMLKVYPFIFLGVAVLLICWIAFLLPCPPKIRLMLLGAFAGIEMFSFFYFKFQIDNTIKEKKSVADSVIKEIKDRQKILVNDEKTAAIAKFASVVSHELKNPLSSLKNIAYYLIKTAKNDDPKGKRMMELLSQEVDRFDRMISSFSDISHAKRINKTSTDVSELIENTLREYAFEPSIELEKYIEPGISADIDPERMVVVLKNLLKNAVSAVGEKGSIHVSLKKAGTFFELSVTDSGSGIEREILEHVFDPMFTTKTKSLGLGLTVVKETVSEHGGRVNVESDKGKGSTFRIFMPLCDLF
jgi:signal transduction histidine kinase